MFTRYIRISLFVVALMACVSQSRAQIPHQIAYQGILTNADGTLLTDGNHTLTLNIYTDATGGSAIYTETQNVVIVKGLFNVMIGSVLPLPGSMKFDRAYFLGVSADGSSELSPRTAFLPAPYAMNAEHANQADNALAALAAGHAGSADTLYLPYSGTGTNTDKPVFSVYNSGSNGDAIAGIGGGGASLGIMTASGVWGTGGSGYFGVVGYSDGGSDNYSGVLGRGGATATGVMALSETGVGLYSSSSAGLAGKFSITNISNVSNAVEINTAGTGEALRAEAQHTDGAAIYGITSDSVKLGAGVVGESRSRSNGAGASAGATGVLGLVSRTNPGGYSAAVRGVNNGTAGLGIGVVGYQAGSGWGVYGEVPKGIAVYGNATNDSVQNIGVQGQTSSPSGIGIRAVYIGSGVGIPFELSNGPIRVSGNNKAAFVHTATAANKKDLNGTDIDNALCNDDPNCFLIVTQKLGAANLVYNNSPIGVYYNPTRNRWEIFNENNVAIPTNAQFNVWVIKQ